LLCGIILKEGVLEGRPLVLVTPTKDNNNAAPWYRFFLDRFAVTDNIHLRFVVC